MVDRGIPHAVSIDRRQVHRRRVDQLIAAFGQQTKIIFRPSVAVEPATVGDDVVSDISLIGQHRGRVACRDDVGDPDAQREDDDGSQRQQTSRHERGLFVIVGSLSTNAHGRGTVRRLVNA
ncbi:MAG TPA: hypothetical protein VN892_07655 [Solirubrobacteraceae bacterium]|nr:hypothetical protein [Solirubrobacteraceae bacterium]